MTTMLEMRKAQINRLQRQCETLERQVDAARTALAQIIAIDPQTQDVLTDDRFDVARSIARDALFHIDRLVSHVKHS